MRKIFVTGIGTEVGKTVISAILVEALKADYWKPVQAGDLDNSDTMKVQSLVSNLRSKFHPEAYRLKHPMSPHASADLEGVQVVMEKITASKTQNETLIIEGAGGLMVPLNHEDMMLDLIKQLSADVVLVSRNYLGSINHTLMSVELLKSRNIPILGIVFNDEENKSTEEIILEYTGLPCLGRVGKLAELNKESVKEISKVFVGI